MYTVRAAYIFSLFFYFTKE